LNVTLFSLKWTGVALCPAPCFLYPAPVHNISVYFLWPVCPPSNLSYAYQKYVT